MIIENKGTWKNRLLVGTPVTGLVRIEWADRRYNQVIPTNWSLSDHKEYLSATMPLRFQVSDAQNIIVKRVIEGGFEWLWLIEQDNIIPPDAFIKVNQYLLKKKVPIISGLYFTKSVPPEPIIYRGRGNSYYTNWKMGDKVWVDGCPTGCILIHASILKAVWNESPEYNINGQITRRVFEEPARVVYNPNLHTLAGEVGTSDLAFCTRIIKDKIFAKAGWPKYAKMKYPILVDTDLFCMHIDDNGRQYPLTMPSEYMPVKKKRKKYAGNKSK
jgi:hypothetical protein